jgi:general secretion pathway protein A
MELPYLDHFHLKEEPFSTSPNPRFLYTSPVHHAALQKIRYVVAARKGLAVCFGKPGMGKTTLARTLHQTFLDDGYQAVFLTNPSFPTANQLLRAIIQEFQVNRSARSFLDLMNIFKAFLYECAIVQNRTLVVLVDEAQTLRFPLLELLRQIINYESNDQKFLQVVLFAQEEFRTALHHARNLENRVVMSSTLENLSRLDTEEMLRFRWQVAGGPTFPFTQEAVSAIYEAAQGVPRSAVILADNALLAAALRKEETIGPETVWQVVKDRGLDDMVNRREKEVTP